MKKVHLLVIDPQRDFCCSDGALFVSGADQDMNRLTTMVERVVNGDCLDVLDSLNCESIDLVYVDPPFFTQKTHSLKSKDRKTEYSFSDIWASRTDYLSYLKARVAKCRQVLKPTGSIVFHCDTSASHYIRVLLDEIFGETMFRSEIIWSYKRWSNSQRCPMPSHQTLFFYSKTDDYKYAQLYEGYSASTNIDQILQRRKRDDDGKSTYKRNEKGAVIVDGEKKGVPIGDVWDLPLLNPKAKERTGYPTQKPILLLDKIISLLTVEGDTVLDPFCGSGTSLVSAKLLNRQYIGIDINPGAVQLSLERLASPIKTTSDLMDNGRESYDQSNKEALSLLSDLGVIPVQRNRGIDAIVPTTAGMKPVLVRVQKPKETVLEAAESLHFAGIHKQPAILILITTDEDQRVGLFNDLPPDVHVVCSVKVSIYRLLKEIGVLARPMAGS